MNKFQKLRFRYNIAIKINEKLTLRASQIAQMNLNPSLDCEVKSTITLISDFLEQENVDLNLIAQKSKRSRFKTIT